METNFIPAGTRVTTPIGIGCICGHTKDGSAYLVSYSRREYTPEQWARISQYEGVVAYRMFDAGEVEAVK